MTEVMNFNVNLRKQKIRMGKIITQSHDGSIANPTLTFILAKEDFTFQEVEGTSILKFLTSNSTQLKWYENYG